MPTSVGCSIEEGGVKLSGGVTETIKDNGL